MLPLIRDEIHDLTCPVCWKRLKVDDSLTSADHARCESCNRSFDVREFGYAGLRTADWAAPPKGVSVRQSPDGFDLTALPRTWLKLVPGGLLVGFMVYLLTHARQGPGAAPGWIFLLPGLGVFPLLTLAVFNLFGRYDVSVRAGKATVFTGVGGIGWTRRFRWQDLTHVTLLRKRQGRQILRVIELACVPDTRRFGRELNDEQRAYVAAYLAEQIGSARLRA